MKRVVRVLGCCLMLFALLGCSSKSMEVVPGEATTPPVISSTKVKVIDVSNDTGELFDVDVIGLLWGSLDDALRKRGMYWTPDSPNPPLTLEAQVIKYKKGNVITRLCLVPVVGNTVLVARCELKDGGRVIASAETKQTIAIGHGGFTIGAWRKIFGEVGEELVGKAVRPAPVSGSKGPS